jgi:acetylornithine deacetylase/succinyl-diaminopimelate desuccinylase-like protein
MSRSIRITTVILCITFSSVVFGQSERSVEQAFGNSGIQRAMAHIDESTDATARLLVEIGGIVSPSGEEHARAQAVKRHMEAIGLSNVQLDDTPNVVGVIPGRSGRALVFVSTLDDLTTVAEHQRAADTPPVVEGDRVVGPGTNTSLVTASMLTAAEALRKSNVIPEHDLVFAAVAQEETGLIGMKKLYEQYKDRAVGFVDILGDGRSISYGAIVIHWWRVIAEGPAGHTLGGGLPNVNQAIGRAVDRILQLPHPDLHKDQRTVINVSVLNSGKVFNHKPETGWFSLDVRSLDDSIVAEMETEVRSVLKTVSEETGIALKMEPFQLTPGGQIPGARESELVTSAEAVSNHLGYEPRVSNMGSSNMNIAIGGGTSAIGLGGSRGGRRGFPDEWADIPTMMRTAKHIVLLSATVGGAKSE